MSWTKEEVLALEQFANAGLTATEIAINLSTHTKCITRNAVIGKLKRIGVPLQSIHMQIRSPDSRARDFLSRKRMWREKLENSDKVKRISAKLIERKAKEFLYKPFVPDGDDFQKGTYGILDIPNFRCRYPVSAEGSPFRFCGKSFDISERHWWCDEHKLIVFRKFDITAKKKNT